MSIMTKPITVVEIPPFPSAASEIWSEAERSDFIDFIARNPTAGDVIRGSGGIRKVRWSRTGMGKRGGARVIYYYHSERLPLFLLTAYPKSQRDTLTDAQVTLMAKIVATILERYLK